MVGIGLKLKLWIQIGASLLLFWIGDACDYVSLDWKVTGLPPIQQNPIMLAIIDNFVHGVIGILSWTVVDPSSVLSGPSRDLILVGFGSLLIDIDHFFAARSLDLSRVLHAPYRGVLHCSGLLFLIALTCLPFKPNWSLLLFVTFIPHHLRDSTRRGLYLYFPYVHTRPLPKLLINSLLASFPWLIYVLRTKSHLIFPTAPPKLFQDLDILKENPSSYPFIV